MLKFSFHPFAPLSFLYLELPSLFIKFPPHCVYSYFVLPLFIVIPLVRTGTRPPFPAPLCGREKVGTLAVMSDFCSFRVLCIDKQN